MLSATGGACGSRPQARPTYKSAGRMSGLYVSHDPAAAIYFHLRHGPSMTSHFRSERTSEQPPRTPNTSTTTTKHTTTMNSSSNLTSSTTCTRAHQAEVAPAAVFPAEAAATFLQRRCATDNNDHGTVRVNKPVAKEEDGHSCSSLSSSSSSASSASSSSDTSPEAVSDIIRKAKRTSESTPSYYGRLNDAPRRDAYRRSTEIGQLKYAAEFLQEFH